MATVNKNFRIKNGLVVEGNTATVNGYDILTKASADQNYIIIKASLMVWRCYLQESFNKKVVCDVVLKYINKK